MVLFIVYVQEFAANYWHELGFPKEKMVIGMAGHGRGFTLANPDVNGVGAPASGPSEEADYTREAGVFSYYEVHSPTFSLS